jgi:ribonuclease HI
MIMNQNHLDETGLPPKKTPALPEVGPNVVHLDEDLLHHIEAVAERKNTDHKALVKEFILERLYEEEKREGILVSSPEVNRHDSGEPAPTSGLVDIYTEGGCRGNPGPGGWAAVIYEGPKPKEIYGAEKNTTNQRMELGAAIEGLRHLNDPTRVRLYSDSAYLLNSVNKGWLIRWEQNGWKKTDKKLVKNADLWRKLLKLSKFHEVEWIKVAGHTGDTGNERAHTLVQRAIEQGRWS